MPSRTFRAVIQPVEGGGAFVEIPFDVEKEFGGKRVPVRARIDGEEYRGSLVRMGAPCHMLIILKEIRERIGKGPGDEVEITVEKDDQPRVLHIPPELEEALAAAPAARAYFDSLAYSHRREYVKWIEEAKRQETRRSRAARAIEMLTEKRKAR